MTHLLSLLLIFISFGTIFPSRDKYFVLRSPNSGLVLDNSEEWVTLQPFTGFSSQLWKLEPTKNGAAHIVSKHDGRVLDYDARYHMGDSWLVVTDRIGAGSNASCMMHSYANDKSVTLPNCQLWHVHFNGHIVNGCYDGKFAVTILKGQNKQGTYLRTYPIGKGEQGFNFQYL